MFTTYRQQRALEESSLARTVNTGEQREAMGTREAVDAAPEIAAPVSKRQTRHRATHKVKKPRRPASSVKQVMRQISLMHIFFYSFIVLTCFIKALYVHIAFAMHFLHQQYEHDMFLCVCL